MSPVQGCTVVEAPPAMATEDRCGTAAGHVRELPGPELPRPGTSPREPVSHFSVLDSRAGPRSGSRLVLRSHVVDRSGRRTGTLGTPGPLGSRPAGTPTGPLPGTPSPAAPGSRPHGPAASSSLQPDEMEPLYRITRDRASLGDSPTGGTPLHRRLTPVPAPLLQLLDSLDA